MTFTQILIALAVLAVIGGFFYFRSLSKKPKPGTDVPKPGDNLYAGNAAPYVPDSSTITDNASGLAYWLSLAPSTRAYMKAPPYFGANGEILDVRGNVVTADNSLAGVSVDLPKNTAEMIARGALETAIKTGNPYSINDIINAGFVPDGIQFAAWFRQVKA